MSKFNEMFTKDVNSKVEKKNGLSYLSWAYAWAEVKKIDENADYVIHEDASGNAFFLSQLGIDCKVSVTIHGKTHTMRLPVMDGANKAMKAEAYEYTTKYGKKTVEAATSFDVNKTIMRCLVKAIAMHGLGLYIYAGEDLPEEVANEVKQDAKPVAAKPEVKTTSPAAKEPTGEQKLVAANPDNSTHDVPEKPVVKTGKAGWGKTKVATTQTTTSGGDLY